MHPLTVLWRHISLGKIALAPQNTTETQQRITSAIHSRDIDVLMHDLCPRLWCLTVLVDRARAEHGGDLPEAVIEAAVVIARTLAGPRRWDVRAGLAFYDWPPERRVGAAFEMADKFMRAEPIFDRVIVRLIEGR